ncbi:MAG: thiamine pyrophosphate-dependent enzyme, partial [Carnobacterium sp.]
RFKGHSKSDKRVYRTKEEEEQWQIERDPLKLTATLFEQEGVASEIELAEIKHKAQAKVAEAVAEARLGENPTLADLYTDVYAE